MPAETRLDLEVIAQLEDSEYLSASRVAADLEAALTVELDPSLAAIVAAGERLVLVGSGGSYAALLTVQYLLDRVLERPVHVLTGKDLVWRRPIWLGPDTPVILSSFSGNTVDVIEALEVATAAGAPSIGITGRAGSGLDRDCTRSIVYTGTSIYEAPITLILRLVESLMTGPDAAPLMTALDRLPEVLALVEPRMPEAMRTAAAGMIGADHLYVTGAGPLSSLAFKLAPVFMENVRIGASFFDTSEMRHGSIEFLERHQPTIVALLGTDEARETTAMIINFVAERGGDVCVLDAADLGDTHPLLTPLVMNSWTQWLVAWSAHERGITDLDERVYMGKGLLSKGQWP